MQRIGRIPRLLAVTAVLCGIATTHAQEAQPEHAQLVEIRDAPDAAPWSERARLQVGLDALPIAGDIHAAYSPVPRLLLGASFGYGLFLSFSGFERGHYYSPRWGVFARYLIVDYIHVDAGVRVGHDPCDDSDITTDEGGFVCANVVGGYAQVAVGYRWVYWAPSFFLGVAMPTLPGMARYYETSDFGWELQPFTLRFMWSALDD